MPLAVESCRYGDLKDFAACTLTQALNKCVSCVHRVPKNQPHPPPVRCFKTTFIIFADAHTDALSRS